MTGVSPARNRFVATLRGTAQPAICNWSKTGVGMAVGLGIFHLVLAWSLVWSTRHQTAKQQTRFRGTSSSARVAICGVAIHGATCLQTRSTLYVLHRNGDEEASSVKLRCGPLSNLARLALGQPRVVFAGKWDHAWPRQSRQRGQRTANH